MPAPEGKTVRGTHTRLGIPHLADIEKLNMRINGKEIYHCKKCDGYASEKTVKLD